MKKKIIWATVVILIFGICSIIGKYFFNCFLGGWVSGLFALTIINTIEEQQNL